MNRILRLVIRHTVYVEDCVAPVWVTLWEAYRSSWHLNRVPDATVTLRAAFHVAHTLRQGQPVHIPVSGVPLSFKCVRLT
jgi:hypothetical protein